MTENKNYAEQYLYSTEITENFKGTFTLGIITFKMLALKSII